MYLVGCLPAAIAMGSVHARRGALQSADSAPTRTTWGRSIRGRFPRYVEKFVSDNKIGIKIRGVLGRQFVLQVLVDVTFVQTSTATGRIIKVQHAVPEQLGSKPTNSASEVT